MNNIPTLLRQIADTLELGKQPQKKNKKKRKIEADDVENVINNFFYSNPISNLKQKSKQ
jgi:hypothetical protein